MGTVPTPQATLPAPGLHRGVPYHEYDAWAAVRHSILRLFHRTPAHAREAMKHPPAPTAAQVLGIAIHHAVLEPQRFAERYARAPKLDLRTTRGKARYGEFVVANLGRSVLSAEEYDACVGIRESVWAHSTARQLLEGVGLNEVSALWRDGETGLPCKSRLDRLTVLHGWSVIADLKSLTDASPRAFQRDIHKYGYAQQGAFYIDGCDALTGDDDKRERKYVFIAAETAPPYAVAVYELDATALGLGRDEYRAHLALYARCVETGVWPAFDQGIGTISLPPWATRFHGEAS